MVMTQRTCPRCRTGKTRLAPCRTFTDKLYRTVTIYPFRCQLCATRFHAYVGQRAPSPRRSFERVPVAFPVWFKPRGTSPHAMGFEGVLENLSLRGCRIRSYRSLPLGTRVELEFQYADCSFPITVDEAVVRSSVDDAIGLRFVQLQRHDERRLGQIVDLWLPDVQPTT